MLKIKDFFKTKEPLLFFLVAFFLIAPGALFIFMEYPDLFFKLDWVKLVILSMVVLVPLSLLNAFVILTFEGTNPSRDGKELVDAFTLSAVVTGIYSFIFLITIYITDWSKAVTVLVVELSLLVTIYIDAKKQTKN